MDMRRGTVKIRQDHAETQTKTHNLTWKTIAHSWQTDMRESKGPREQIDMNFTGDTGMRQKRTKNLTNKKPWTRNINKLRDTTQG